MVFTDRHDRVKVDGRRRGDGRRRAAGAGASHLTTTRCDMRPTVVRVNADGERVLITTRPGIGAGPRATCPVQRPGIDDNITSGLGWSAVRGRRGYGWHDFGQHWK